MLRTFPHHVNFFGGFKQLIEFLVLDQLWLWLLKWGVLDFHFGMGDLLSNWLAFARSTGNDVSGHYECHYFLFFSTRGRCSRRWSFGRLTDNYKCHYFPFSIFFLPFSLSQPFLIEGVLGSKNLFSKRWWERWIWQAVWHCRQWVSAPGAARLVLF